MKRGARAGSSVYLRGHGIQCHSSQWCSRVVGGMPYLREEEVKVVKSEGGVERGERSE